VAAAGPSDRSACHLGESPVGAGCSDNPDEWHHNGARVTRLVSAIHQKKNGAHKGRVRLFYGGGSE